MVGCPELGGGAAGAAEQSAVDDEAGADTGAQFDVDGDLGALAGAPGDLGERAEVADVVDDHGKAEPRPEVVGGSQADPGRGSVPACRPSGRHDAGPGHRCLALRTQIAAAAPS